MFKFEEFLNEVKKIEKLSYSIFDWDDNILKMYTLLHYQKNVNGKWIDVDITPEEFADIRKKYASDYMDNPEWRGDFNTSFIEFRDFGPRGPQGFVDDVETSIKMNNFGPSWETFINVLKNGNLFAIVTTRGHEPPTLKRGVRWIIENFLSEQDKEEMKENLSHFNKLFGDNISDDNLIDDYLDKCYFIGLFSSAFKKEYGFVPGGTTLNKGKQVAIEYFTNYVRNYAKEHNMPMKIGFSDDDVRFSDAAKELFMGMERSLDFLEDFYVFNTSDPNLKGGVKTKITA